MLRIYYIPISNDNYIIIAQAEILDNSLPFSIPWKFLSYIMEYENRSDKILYYFTLGDTTQYNTAQCYFTSKFPKNNIGAKNT